MYVKGAGRGQSPEGAQEHRHDPLLCRGTQGSAHSAAQRLTRDRAAAQAHVHGPNLAALPSGAQGMSELRLLTLASLLVQSSRELKKDRQTTGKAARGKHGPWTRPPGQ